MKWHTNLCTKDTQRHPISVAFSPPAALPWPLPSPLGHHCITIITQSPRYSPFRSSGASLLPGPPLYFRFLLFLIIFALWKRRGRVGENVDGVDEIGVERERREGGERRFGWCRWKRSEVGRRGGGIHVERMGEEKVEDGDRRNKENRIGTVEDGVKEDEKDEVDE